VSECCYSSDLTQLSCFLIFFGTTLTTPLLIPFFCYQSVRKYTAATPTPGSPEYYRWIGRIGARNVGYNEDDSWRFAPEQVRELCVLCVDCLDIDVAYFIV
jgi:hypothetical protein